jgi:SNF2 family DNA or RNA helicase/uncharacterized Zn finger protein
MKETFGKTWWGELWLRSLTNIDYSRHLSQGAVYARKGNVKNLKISRYHITAKVTGERKTPYRITVFMPAFTGEQIDLLMTEIIKRPVVIAKLLNHEPDPVILSIAESLDMKVLPRQWKDFMTQCTCRDRVPCKHLLAVFYMLSREIDSNPFLIFEMHGLNLFDELRRRGIYIYSQRNTAIPLLESQWKIRESTPEETPEDAVYRRVDFSQLQNISKALIQLLSDAPSFYPSGNFRDRYAAQLGRITGKAGRILSRRIKMDTFFPLPDGQAITGRTTLGLTVEGSRLNITGGNHEIKTLDHLIAALFALNPDHLPDLQPSVAAFHKILMAALHLSANGMIIPQIVQSDYGEVVIRWLPALLDSRVKVLVERLSGILPGDLLLVQMMFRRRRQALPIENRTVELLSFFIGRIVVQFSRATANVLDKLFFKARPYTFSSVGETGLPGRIKVWLDSYYLTSETCKPVITVSEAPGEQFDVQISVEDTANAGQPVPLDDILKQNQYDNQRYRILQGILLLTPFIRGLEEYVNGGGNVPIRFSVSEFAPFLTDVLPAVRLLDIKIMLPKSLQELLRPKVSVKLKRKSSSQAYVRLDDLLEFDWQVAVGDDVISPDEFNQLLNKASRLFKFKEKYIYVSDADIEKLQKALTGNRQISSCQLLQTALAEEYEGAAVLLTSEVRKLMEELSATEYIPLPQGLKAELRPYQQRGFSWLYRNSRMGFGSIIADDMGLGKTLQVISVLLKFKEENAIDKRHKALVVVPTGLLTNWQAEIARFAPSLSSYIYHGATRSMEQFDADVMLTTYGVLRSDADRLKKQKWRVMIIDEAQNIKNYDTAQAEAVKSIPSNVRIAMSGTPVENRLTEFWSIMDYANRGYLGNIRTFKNDYANPIQIFSDEQVTAKFRRITSPFMMRRMKSDKTIISDLPDKIEQNQYALLTGQQAALYEKTMRAAMEEIEGCTGADVQTLFKRQGLVLQLILALKQICNHPTQFLKNGVFDASLSGKTELLLELLDSIIHNGEKALIFTQFREMGDLLERFISGRFGETPMFYHGGCSVNQREEMIDRFQHNRADKLFILSLKAAGTGLNLTAASHVIHYDLWWNPAVENQATDRAYRIGQEKNVIVHRLICKNTFEERIDDMIQKKKHLAEVTVATGENWIGKLSNRELREIFG